MPDRPNLARLIQPGSDPLDLLLEPLRPDGVLYCNAHLTAPWGVDLSELAGITSLLVVLTGECLLELDGCEPRRMQSGSIALIPRGTAHRVRSHEDAECLPLSRIPVEMVSRRYEILRHGGGGPATRIAYGAVGFDDPAARRMLDTLPDVLVPSMDDDRNWLLDTVHLLAREARSMLPGSEPILTRLADILVVQTIRDWLRTGPVASSGWIAALRDPRIGSALRAMNRSIHRPWTLGSLAKEAGMSRSGFSARFTELVGESAMRHLARLRMERGKEALRSGNRTLAQVARDLGYTSDAAFSKTYRKFWSEPPGRSRRGLAASA